MKRLVAMLLAAILVGAMLAGCGPAAGQPSSTQQSSTQGSNTQSTGEKPLQADIDVWIYPTFDEAENSMRDNVLPAYAADYPGVKVNLEMLNGDTGPEKIMVAMGSGSTPDLLIDVMARVLPAVGKGLAVPLSDVYSELSDIMNENIVNCGKVGDDYYVLATETANGYFMNVNMGLAERLGVDKYLPEDHRTWSYDDFLTLCRETVKAGAKDDVKAVTLYAGSRSSDAMYYSFLIGSGADILNEDHTAVVANTPEGVKFFDLLLTLVDEELCLPGAATLKDADLAPYVISEKVMICLPAGGYQSYVQLVKDVAEGVVPADYRMEPYMYPTPDGKGATKTLTFGSYGGVVFKNSGDADRHEAAKRFLKEIIVNTGYGQDLADIGGVGFADVDYNYPNDYVKEMAGYVNEWNAKYATATDGVGTLETWWADVRETFYPELQALFTHNKTSQEALDSFVNNANAAIKAATAE